MRKLFLILMTLMVSSWTLMAQSHTYHGTVVDASSNEPLIGATILPVGGGRGVATDVDGKFSLTVPASVTKVQVSYVGYTTTTATLADNMTVKLVTTDTSLDDLVVMGYGSAKKLGSVVGSVAVVGEATLKNTATPTFVDALQGQVAGLSIYSNSGEPSSVDNSVSLRGINSLNGGNTPLYILDGAPVTSTVFTTLNPADIENIAVLKDAASLAIYGSRAANGVIVITSKKGKFAQKPKFTFRATAGWSNIASNKIEMMNSQQYIQYRDLIGQPVSQEIKDLVDNYGISTDWTKEMFNTAPTYSLEGSVQGGGENFNYYISFNHMDQEGIMVQSGMRRETLRANLEAKVTNWFKVGLQTNLGYAKYGTNTNAIPSDDGRVYAANPVVFARMAMPYDSPYYYTFDDNGGIVYGDKAQYLHYTGSLSPEFYVNNYYDYNRNRVTLNTALYEQFNPIKGLTLRAQQALDAYDSRNSLIGRPTGVVETPMGDSYDPDLSSGRNTQSFGRYYQFTYTNTAEYRFDVNDIHEFSFLLGQESIITKSDSFQAGSTGQTDLRQMLLHHGTTISIANVLQSIAQRTSNSFFANATYNFDSRYFIDASFRRDGSSKFAPGHRWANFFSVGAMWNITGEKFMEHTATWLDDLRLRASYGTTGNTAGIGDYAYFGLVGAGSNTYNGETAIGIAQAPNYDLTWETVRTTDVGLSFSVLKGKLSGEIDFYHKNTVDMLMDIPYSYTTGFSAGAGNIASMTNTGVDVDLKSTIFDTPDWTWSVKANFNYNRNRITSLFNGRDYFTIANTGLRYEVGHDAGEFYYVRYVGVDPRDGCQLWLDANGNLTKNYNEEKMSAMTGKSRYAPWTGGFGTDLRWKWFSLHLDFAWAAKKYMINNDRYFIENSYFATSFNQMSSMLNVWTTPGQVTDIPKVGEEVQFDTRFLEDASFMRLKNLTFQYTMPSQLVRKAGFDNVAFRFTGRNLFTVTKYTGFDPEPGSNIVAFWYPNTRQFEFGVDFTF